jgi:hypothetical protein
VDPYGLSAPHAKPLSDALLEFYTFVKTQPPEVAEEAVLGDIGEIGHLRFGLVALSKPDAKCWTNAWCVVEAATSAPGSQLLTGLEPEYSTDDRNWKSIIPRSTVGCQDPRPIADQCEKAVPQDAKQRALPKQRALQVAACRFRSKVECLRQGTPHI